MTSGDRNLVTFYDGGTSCNGTSLGTATPNGSGIATATTESLPATQVNPPVTPPPTYDYVTACVAAGGNYAANTSSALLQTVYPNAVPPTPSGYLALLVGGDGPGYSGDRGPASDAQINLPTVVAFDPSGNLYISDSGNSRIRVVYYSGTPVIGNVPSPVDGDIYTFAGGGSSPTTCTVPLGAVPPDSFGNGCAATSAVLNTPNGVTFDTSGNLYIADYGDHMVRVIYAAGTIPNYPNQNVPTLVPGNIYAVAGNGTAGYTGDKGVATSAELKAPGEVAVDANGNIFISDYRAKISSG